MAIQQQPCLDPWFNDCCDEITCCDEHIPALIACDLCAAGGVAQGPALMGSDAAQACCIGGVWQYPAAGATLTVSNPAGILVDTVIVTGQSADSITTPFGTADSLCDIGCGSISQPIVQYGQPTGGAMSATFNGGPSPGKVERVIFGRRIPFPDNAMRVGASDPWAGSGITYDIKMSECKTPILAMPCRQARPISIEIDCINEEYYKTVWLPYIKYAARYGIAFMPSINRCPDQVFVGWLEQPQSGSWYSPFHRRISLQATGYTENPLK
jgi:hypothetical protein